MHGGGAEEDTSAGRVKYSAVWKGTVGEFLRQNPTVHDVYYTRVAELTAALQVLGRFVYFL